MTTTDLKDFGQRELALAGDLLKMYSQNRLTKIAENYFQDENVHVMFNQHSGYVFLTNENYDVIMENDNGELDLYITTPYNSEEGFYSNLMEDYSEFHKEDKEYLDNFKD